MNAVLKQKSIDAIKSFPYEAHNVSKNSRTPASAVGLNLALI